jgi:hypothetical protein
MLMVVVAMFAVMMVIVVSSLRMVVRLVFTAMAV